MNTKVSASGKRKPSATTLQQSLDDRISLLESRLDAISVTSTSIAADLERRSKQWKDVFTIVSATVTLIASAAFAWQLWKAAEISVIAANIEAERERTTEEQRYQAQLAGHMAKSVTQISLGYRDMGLLRFGSSLRRGADASAVMDEYLPDFPNESDSEALKSTLSKRAFLPFEQAATECLIGSYELQARSLYSIWDGQNATELDQIVELGDKLIKYRPRRWEGYHFKGLALSELAKLPGTRPSDSSRMLSEAEKLYRRAFFEDSVGANIDRLNLAELLLTEMQLTKAKSLLLDYVRIEGNEIPREHRYLAAGYLAICTLLTESDESRRRITATTILNDIRDQGKSESPVFRNFNLTAIQRFSEQILTPEFQKKGRVSATQAREVNGILNAMIAAGKGKDVSKMIDQMSGLY